MNDFSELENELRKLRPLQPSAELVTKIEEEITNPVAETDAEPNVVRPDRFQTNWPAIGLGLAAAAVLLLFARVGFQISPKQSSQIASSPSPALGSIRAPMARDEFVPAGATQVVYKIRDEGLRFPDGAEQPLRRFRSQTRETLQWQNLATGASLRVSYPREEVELIPVSGQ